MAITITAAQLAAQIGLETSDPRATQLLAVVSALVSRYAPDAPEDVLNEAIIRAAGWLQDSRHSSVVSELNFGGALDMRFRSPAASCVRASGAAALLSPWRVRRATPAVEAT